MPRSLSDTNIIAINAGSSSIKFAVFRLSDPLKRILRGKIDRIGLPNTRLIFSNDHEENHGYRDLKAANHQAATVFLIEWLEKQIGFGSITAIGHRVVHGMDFADHQKVTDSLLQKLLEISAYDPDHLPLEIELIKTFKQHHPDLPQAVCFDTVFHSGMPPVARILPLPRKYFDQGIKRYGFHGLSYTYLMKELSRRVGEANSNGRVIIAHLGNGASLAAIKNGRSIDTSMGFTPASGLVMGTRPGDLDPGVAWYLMKVEKLSPQEYNNLINHQSGLKGVSGNSSDMRDLLDSQASDYQAAEAVELFCYQARKWIGAYAAVLDGLDILVFAGGIGESSSEIRRRICSGLGFLGIDIDEARNDNNAEIISQAKSPVQVHVMHTDEESVIAKAACRVLNISLGKGSYHENVKG